MLKVYFNAEQIDAEITDSQIGITVPCDCDNGFLEIVWEFEADDSEYVLFLSLIHIYIWESIPTGAQPA